MRRDCRLDLLLRRSSRAGNRNHQHRCQGYRQDYRKIPLPLEIARIFHQFTDPSETVMFGIAGRDDDPAPSPAGSVFFGLVHEMRP